MLINFNHIKTFYNALVQKMKGFRGNWEQNDDTADDYIKNRTHWSEGVKEKVIIDWTIDFNSGEITSPMGTSGPIIYQAFIEDTSLTGFIVGQKYTVIWDNKTYECIAKDFNGIGIIGNESFIGYMGNSALEDTGEPFFIGIEEGYGGIVSSTEADNHTCIIKTLTEVVHKLDKKFIDMPDNLATEDDLSNVAFSGDYYDLNNLPTIYNDVVRYNASQSLSDSQKNQVRANIGAFSGSYDDLTEKPCYQETTYEHHASFASYVSGWTKWSNSSSSTTTARYLNSTVPRVTLDETYRIVIYNSSGAQLYSTECMAKIGPGMAGNTRTMIGNSTIWHGNGENTGESVLIYWHNETGDNATVFVDAGVISGAYRTVIHKRNDALVQLDEKYIPDTIARTADVPVQVQPDLSQNDPTAADYVKGRTHHMEASWHSVGWIAGTTFQEKSDLGIRYAGRCSQGLTPIENARYRMTINGTVLGPALYRVNDKFTDEYCLGNAYLYGLYTYGNSKTKEEIEAEGYVDTKEDFVYVNSSFVATNNPNIIAGKSVQVFTEMETVVVKPLDEKYIPDTIPKVQSAAVGQTVIVDAIDENGKPIKWRAGNIESGGIDMTEYAKKTDIPMIPDDLVTETYVNNAISTAITGAMEASY